MLGHWLHPDCYSHNPGFRRSVAENGPQFKAYAYFKKKDIEKSS
jgi:hypothetical protein